MKALRFLSVLVVLVSLYGLSRAADFLIWDLDGNLNSGDAIRQALVQGGYDGVYTQSIAGYLGSLSSYRAIFICTGVFPNDYDLSWEPLAVDSLVSYLTNYDSTNIYLEGGNAWVLNRYHDLNPYFNIQGLANGSGDLDTILGQAGTFTAGMAFAYQGDNAFIDRLSPLSTAFVIFENNSPVYNNAIAYDDGDPSYRTIGTSFEFGGLVDGAPPSTRAILADTIMHFFRISRSTYNWDAAVLSIDIPDLVIPNQQLTPRATVRNLGLNTATFGVTCNIPGYTSTDSVYNLAPDSVRQIAFTPDWAPGGAGSSYWVTVYTVLAGDQRRTNDTLRKQITSWDDRWYIISPYHAGTFPTMDGVMSPGEWDAAEVRDVSDFLGRSGSPWSPGSAYFYVMNSSDSVYMALDARADGSSTDGDAFYLWFEDNHDNSWPPYPDSTEGRLTMTHHPEPAGPGYDFCPVMSDSSSLPYVVGIAGWSGDNSGHMQYELIVPFGTANHHLNAGPGDTVGLWLGASNEAPQTGYAWWPTSSTIGGGNPADHGDLIFSTGSPIVHDGRVDSITAPPDTVWGGSVQFPQAGVRNLGNVAEICTVKCNITPGAYSSEVIAPLDPDSSALVNFSPWDVPPSGATYLMTVRIVVPEDNNPGNDTLSKYILAYHHDGGVESILSPPDMVYVGGTYNVWVLVRNYGTLTEDSVKVKCTIDGYEDSTWVYGLAPGDSDTAAFVDWIAPDTGQYRMRCWTLVPLDTDPSNDTTWKDIVVTGVEELLSYQLPVTSYQLSQNQPNPFFRTTTISYAVPRSRGAEEQRRHLSTYQLINLSVYDLAGRLVRTLVDETQQPGYYSVVWDGRDQNGSEVRSGVYFYQLKAGDFTATRKLTVLR